MFDTVHIAEDSKFEIYSSEDMKTHSVYIQDELSTSIHDYAGLRVFLENVPTKGDDVRVYGAIDGGGLSAAQGICASMRRCKGFVTSYVDSPCHSSGALIALSGDALVMAKDALLLFHTGTTSVSGEMGHLEAKVAHKLQRGMINDEHTSMPFLTRKEVDSMYTEGKEIIIFGDDKDLNARIKRHFK